MIFGLFFEDQTAVCKLSDDIYIRNSLLYNNKKYAKQNVPMSFELGFYNWLIEGTQLIGISFRFMADMTNLIDFLANKKYKNVTIEDNQIFVFFGETKEYWIDYIEGFSGLFLLGCESQYYALSFEMPDDFEYKIDLLLKYI